MEVFEGGYDIYFRGILLDSNVLGSQGYIDNYGEWHEGPIVMGGSPFVPGRSIGAVARAARLAKAGRIGQILDASGRATLGTVWAGEVAPTVFSEATRRQLALHYLRVARANPIGSARRFFQIHRARFLMGRGPNPGPNVNEFVRKYGYPF